MSLDFVFILMLCNVILDGLSKSYVLKQRLNIERVGEAFSSSEIGEVIRCDKNINF